MSQLETIQGTRIGPSLWPETNGIVEAPVLEADHNLPKSDQAREANANLLRPQTQVDIVDENKNPIEVKSPPVLSSAGPSKNSSESNNKFREYVLNISNHVASAMSFLTFCLQFVLPKDNRFKAFCERVSKKAVVTAFGANGAVCATDAYQRGDYSFIVPQVLDIIVPYATKDDANVTLNRGCPIGGYNALAELKSFSGKASYSSLSENLQYLKIGFDKFLEEFKANPAKAFVSFGKGTGGVVYGFLTSIAPFIAKLPGCRAIGSLIRHWGGIGVEISKMQLARLLKGQWRYFSSGVFMCSSSLVDLFGKIFPSFEKKATYLNWALNLCGKRLWLNSVNSGELNSESTANPVKLSDLVRLVPQELFGIGKPKSALGWSA